MASNPNRRNKSKPSVGESISAQAARITSKRGNIENLSITRIERGVSTDGKETLHAVFPNPNGGNLFQLDLSYLLEFKNIAEMFCDAFLVWGGRVGRRTRIEGSRTLTRYFFNFLSINDHKDISPLEIDDHLLAAFNNFLQRPYKNRKPLSPGTVGNALGSLRSILGALNNGPHAGIAAQISERVPYGPIGQESRIEPVEVLSYADLLAIITAAEFEFRTLQMRWENGKRFRADGRIEYENGNRDFRKNLGVCLAAIEAKYPGIIPDAANIIRSDGFLGRAFSGVHKAREVTRYFYPNARDLVPFIILLGVGTAFNADTLLTLRWSNVHEDIDRIGTPAVKIIGIKHRASQDQVRLLDASADDPNQISIKDLLKLLREMTQRIRPFVNNPEHSDRLFVFIQQTDIKNPKSFGNPDLYGPTTDQVWVKSLKNFCKDHKLSPFTLGQLRPTILDMTLALNGDLRAAQELGNHARPHTTWTFYTSSGTKKRFQEKIAEILVLRDRWISSNGVIDPRHRAIRGDIAAATPGFICFDPFESPRPNQQKGRICTAFGECPGCQLAGAYLNSPIAVAHYVALQKSIYESHSSMNPRTWLLRWRNILADLNALLALIPADVMNASSTYNVKLPTVG